MADKFENEEVVVVQCILDDIKPSLNSTKIDESPLLKRTTNHYGVIEFFAHSTNQSQSRLHVVKKSSPIATKESIAHSLHILANSALYDLSLSRRMYDIPHKLSNAAVSICATSDNFVVEYEIGKNLCAIAMLFSIYNRIFAFDIYLIAADYYYFVLKSYNDAAIALEKAANIIHNDTMRVVGVLQQASKIYEDISNYSAAIMIEKQLERFDLSVNWIEDCRKRQSELMSKNVY